MTIQDIHHFLALDDRLLTGGMPTADQLADARRAGVQAIINLAVADAPRALPQEASIVQALGLDYVNIPVQWEHPQRADLDAFMDAMDSRKGLKLLVHCQANYRVTAFVALYRVLRLGWAPQLALDDIRRVWNPDEYPVWQKFLAENLAPSG